MNGNTLIQLMFSFSDGEIKYGVHKIVSAKEAVNTITNATLRQHKQGIDTTAMFIGNLENKYRGTRDKRFTTSAETLREDFIQNIFVTGNLILYRTFSDISLRATAAVLTPMGSRPQNVH